jgi:hypothetical protein
MNPKWNPIVLMVLGTALMVFASLSAYFVAVDIFAQVVSLIVLAFGALTMASGVVLAYLAMYRDPVPRLGRR